MPLPLVTLIDAVHQINAGISHNRRSVQQLLEHSHEQIVTALETDGVDFPCPNCGRQLELTTTVSFYGRDYSRDGLGGSYRWVCSNWPYCNTHIGCHGQTYVPLGMPASYGLRVLRQRCHVKLDTLWVAGHGFTRNEAYQWLANQMDLPLSACHVAVFNGEQCKKAIELLNQYLGVDDNDGLREDGDADLSDDGQDNVQ